MTRELYICRADGSVVEYVARYSGTVIFRKYGGGIERATDAFWREWYMPLSERLGGRYA